MGELPALGEEEVTAANDGRERQIQAILDFVSAHRESTASLAICRQALRQGVNRVDGTALVALSRHLRQANGEEIAGYYDIVM